MSDEQKLFLSPDEAREVLGIGRATMYRRLSDGSVPSVKIGKLIRVPTAALTQLADRACSQPVGAR
jgi:excisionase family DNA binding protein